MSSSTPWSTYEVADDRGADPAAVAAAHPPAERRAFGRLAQEASLEAAWRGMASAQLVLLLTLGGGGLLAPPTWRNEVALALAALPSMAWLLLDRHGPRPAKTWPLLRDSRVRRFALAAAVALSLLPLSVAAAWPGALGLGEVPALWAAVIALPALAFARALAPLGAPAAVALLPCACAAFAAWPPAGAPVTAWLPPTLPGLAVILLAVRRHRRGRAAVCERLRMQAHLRQLEGERDAARRADEDKRRFLAVACHDLRQPLHALGLFAATLERRLAGAPEEALARRLAQSLADLDGAFKAMLDISRLDAAAVDPCLQPVPLNELFHRLQTHYIGLAEQRALVLRFAAGGKSARSDPRLLERILGNLVQNAIRYTERGGVAVVARSTPRHLNIEVWDTGIGLRAEDLPLAFEEFSPIARARGAQGCGLGIGLAIVRRLARLLGHRLTIRSQPGRGTMVRVGIPLGVCDGDLLDRQAPYPPNGKDMVVTPGPDS